MLPASLKALELKGGNIMNAYVLKDTHLTVRAVKAMRKAALTLTALMSILTPPQDLGQPTTRPEFEVASVKPGAGAGRPQFLGSRSPGTFTAQNINLRFLIRVAYGVRSFEVLGGPRWIDSDTYDITAKPKVSGERGQTTPRREPVAEMFLMLQPLLEDRFKLRVHRETRELPVYSLTVAKGGVRMQQSKCTPVEFPSPPAAAEKPCPNQGYRPGTNGVNRTLDATGVDIPGLLMFLANTMRREVIDKTGLSGRFDFHLEWAPEEATAPPVVGQTDDPTKQTPSVGTIGPSIFTALQEQLGLKLESDRAPVEVLVIDNIEKPEAN